MNSDFFDNNKKCHWKQCHNADTTNSKNELDLLNFFKFWWSFNVFGQLFIDVKFEELPCIGQDRVSLNFVDGFIWVRLDDFGLNLVDLLRLSLNNDQGLETLRFLGQDLNVKNRLQSVRFSIFSELLQVLIVPINNRRVRISRLFLLIFATRTIIKSNPQPLAFQLRQIPCNKINILKFKSVLFDLVSKLLANTQNVQFFPNTCSYHCHKHKKTHKILDMVVLAEIIFFKPTQLFHFVNSLLLFF